MEATRVSQPAGPAPLVRTTSNNERLPFDVLGLIFHQYSLESTYPPLKLETILLVCRAWASAALGHKALWSRFNISIHDSDSLLYWRHNVPLWLSRCSTTCLFDIDIVLDPPDSHTYSRRMDSNPYFSVEEELLLTRIALDLAGLEGQIARRWRSLRALGFHRLPYAFPPLLSFPTPNLIDLELHWINSDDEECLETPLLKKLRIEYSSCTYPDLENVTDLTICAEGRTRFDEEAVSKAQKLVKLSAYCNSTYSSLRGYFPFLEYLRLEFIQDEEFLGSFSAPHLKTLSLCHGDGLSLYLTSYCPGIPFHALEELELASSRDGRHLMDPDEDDYIYIDGISLILNAAVNIRELRTRDRIVVKFVLELLGDLSKFLDHRFTLKYLECTMELCQGEARLDRIAGFRSEAMLQGKEDDDGSSSDNE